MGIGKLLISPIGTNLWLDFFSGNRAKLNLNWPWEGDGGRKGVSVKGTLGDETVNWTEQCP